MSNAININAHQLEVELTFTEELLGTASSNPDLYRDYIASNATDAATMEEEVAALGVDEVERKEMTVFPRTEEGAPFLYDYQIKGFFKGAIGFLRGIPGTKASKIRAYKKMVDGVIFPQPRVIPLILPEGETLGTCQRPLRAQTMQGERIALSNSETAPAGTRLHFEVLCMTKDAHGAVIEALNYGRLHGMGQWRNSGKGRFTYDIIRDEVVEI